MAGRDYSCDPALLPDHGLVLNDIGERKIFALQNDLFKAINCHVISVIKKKVESGRISEASHAGWTLEALAERLACESKITVKDYNSLIQRWLIHVDNALTGQLYIPLCLAHGDLTPWNAWLNDQDKLSIIDFERFDHHSPAGFDFFHFYISSFFDLTGNVERNIANTLKYVKKIIVSETSLSEKTVDYLARLYCLFCSGLRLLELCTLDKPNLTHSKITRLLIAEAQHS